MNLLQYFEQLLAHQRTRDYGRPHLTIEGINTLWIPQWSGNRTATLNLNHQVNKFDEKLNLIYGENGNCSTPYTVMEVPLWFNETHLKNVAEILCKEMDKPNGYPSIRVLKAERIEAIQRIISSIEE